MANTSPPVSYDTTVRYDLQDIPLPVAASDLIAWYPFRSGTGEDITAGDSNFGDSTDYSATVNGATYNPNAGVTDIKTGANSGAFEFDGVDDSLNTGFSGPQSDYTIMAFIKTDSTDRQAVLANERAGVGDGIFFGFKSGAIEISDFSRYGESTGGSISKNTFTHIAMTSEVKGYIDGNVVTQAPQGPFPTPRPILIGEQAASSVTFFNGIIDDVRIYNEALSQSQINQISQNTKP